MSFDFHSWCCHKLLPLVTILNPPPPFSSYRAAFPLLPVLFFVPTSWRLAPTTRSSSFSVCVHSSLCIAFPAGLCLLSSVAVPLLELRPMVSPTCPVLRAASFFPLPSVLVLTEFLRARIVLEVVVCVPKCSGSWRTGVWRRCAFHTATVPSVAVFVAFVDPSAAELEGRTLVSLLSGCCVAFPLV